MVIPARDPKKPIPVPSTKEEMLNAFGFTQSHCDYCQDVQDHAKVMLLMMCQCKRKYFCEACSRTKDVHAHQQQCTLEKIKQNAKNDAKYADDSRNIVSVKY